jgi:outer membrane protein OmpA-like peptidoglycan-associated protein
MASLRMSGRQKKASTARALAFLAAVASGLGGCSWSDANPVEWYRDVSGIDKSDLADKGQRNEINLEAGSQEPYPNLGTVPGPPDRAMSTVDLTKLQEGLAADRKNAEYSDEQMRQGNPVPPMPGKAPPANAVLAQNGEPAPGQASASAPAAAAGAQAPAAGQGAPPAHSPPTKGSAAPPQESSLVSPSIPNPPQGQMPTAAPPPPTGVEPARQQAAASASAQPAAQAPAPRPAPSMPPLPEQQAALPPLPPAVPPVGPIPGVMRAPQGHQHGVSLEAGAIQFGPDGKTLSPEDDRRLAEVAQLQKRDGGSVRIIAYGRRAFGADAAREQLDSFSEALDRANLIAQALTRLGVPAKRITVQAQPEQLAGGVPAGEAQILLDY